MATIFKSQSGKVSEGSFRAEHSSPHVQQETANMYGTLPRGAMTDCFRRTAGLAPFSSRKTGGVQKPGGAGSPQSHFTRSVTMPSRYSLTPNPIMTGPYNLIRQTLRDLRAEGSLEVSRCDQGTFPLQAANKHIWRGVSRRQGCDRLTSLCCQSNQPIPFSPAQWPPHK